MKINKTRIVNLNYNDGKRTIYDECFDYRNGKNVLFSMDNGLGKTVIIQFMLQPFLRKNRDLAKRDLASYFKNPNPVYVMHELLLESDEKLLIGVLLKGEKTDGKNRVKVVGFTHKYQGQNEFDIVNIPFVKNENGINKIISYSEAESMLKTEAKTNNRLAVYNFDDSVQKKRYFNLLLENGVNSKEWETLIRKINQEESGLSELFSNCETTPELLRKQIIPIIDEKLRVYEDRIESLVMHARKYIDTYMEHQQEIQKSVEYRSFLQETQDIDEDFNECDKYGKELEKSNRFMKSLFMSINHHMENKQDNESTFLQLIAKKENEIKELKYQQISYDASIEKEQLDETLDNIASARASLDEINTEIDEINKNKSIQECAKHYARLKQKEASLFALKETLKNNQMDEQELIRTINEYKATLKDLLEESLDDAKSEYESIEEKLNAEITMKDKTSAIIKKIQEENVQLNEEISKAELIVRTYKDKQALLMAENSQFEKMVYENPNESEKDIVSRFSDEISESKKTLMAEKSELLEKSIPDCEAEIQEKSKILEESQTRRIEIKNSLYKMNIEKEQILKNKNDVYEAVKKYDLVHEINERNLDIIKQHISNEIARYSSIRKDLISEYNSIEHQLFNLGNHQLFDIDTNIVALLKENNIRYMLGFDWLKTKGPKSINERVALVRKNPLLPHSIIVDDEDMEAFEKIDFSNTNIANIPVFAPSTLNDVQLNVFSNSTYRINNIRYLIPFDISMLDDASYEKYVDNMKNKLEDIKTRLDVTEKSIDELSRDKAYLSTVSFDATVEEKLLVSIENAENSLSEIETQISDLEESISSLKAEISSMNILVNSKEREISSLYMIQNRCLELASLAEEYDEMKIVINSQSEKYKNNQKEIQTLSNAIVKSDAVISKYNVDKIQAKNSIKVLENDIARIGDVEEVSVEWEGTISELKETIDSMESKLSKSISSIKNDIDSVEEDISYIRNDIQRAERRYGLEENDYSNVQYNEDLFDHYEEMIYMNESRKEDIIDEINEYERYQAVYESRYEDILEDIEELGYHEPIDSSMVVSKDYDKLISQAEDELKSIEENNAESLKLYETFNACITKLKKYIKSFDADDDVYVEKDLSKLKENIALLDETILKMAEIKDLRSKKENEIRYALNNLSRKYNAVDEQIKLILADNDISSVHEKLELFKDSLRDMLEYLELTTKNIHDEEMFVINEAIEYACSVYSELVQIDKQSKIFINGKNRQMLQIKAPVEYELSKENVEYFVRNTITEIVDNYHDINVDKVLSTSLKSVNLFEKLVNGFDNIKFYIYKIEKHSLIRKEWKEINSENSGGEQFVSVFILFISILSYMRNDNENENNGKVLIMDNPFAKTNAEHLLVPMFDIAKKFNTQLICFSGIGGSSVFNRFDVIYASKIIKDKYRENEILQFTDSDSSPETVELLGISINKEESAECKEKNIS